MSSVIPRWLLWISGKHRTTGAIETAGFWTGSDVDTFTVEGESRTYQGAGALLNIEPLTYRKGLDVQMQRVSLSIIDDAVEQAIRVYDPRLAPVELHLAQFSAEDNTLLSITRMFKGWVDTATISEAAFQIGDAYATAVCELTLASSAREGTRRLTSKKSDSSQRKRDTNDAFRQYADVSGVIPVVWMEDSENAHEVRPMRRRWIG